MSLSLFKKKKRPETGRRISSERKGKAGAKRTKEEGEKTAPSGPFLQEGKISTVAGGGERRESCQPVV